MNLPIVWLPEAAAELQDARDRYAAIRPELGQRFAQAIQGTVQSIATSPFLFAVVSNGRRRAGVKRFPYGLFFLAEPDRIVVLACFHGKRNPSRWQGRTT